MFADQTSAHGLQGQAATLASWRDLDGDGHADLYLGGADGRPRLWRNASTGFEPVADAGFDHAQPDRSLAWADLDGDGLDDVVLETPGGTLIYRNLGSMHFERVELPLPVVGLLPEATLQPEWSSLPESALNPGAASVHTEATGRRGSGALAATSSHAPAALAPGVALRASVAGPFDPLTVCALSVEDQFTGGCITASSLPTLGTLYPLGTEFHIDSATSYVGINNLAPSHRLHVVEPAGVGVFGQGGTHGVRGDANLASGSGDRFGGFFTSSGGSNNIGVIGQSDTGVFGSGLGLGVLGSTTAPYGKGVEGTATATTGATIGVHGKSASIIGIGVHGEATDPSGSGTGVYGTSASPFGTGVLGESTGTGAGVRGRSNSSSDGAVGVYGVLDGLNAGADAAGVRGESNAFTGGATGVGVLGIHNDAGDGVRGTSASGSGVHGEAQSGFGVLGNSQTGDGVRGTTGSAAAAGGSFEGPNLAVRARATSSGLLGTAIHGTSDALGSDPSLPAIGVRGTVGNAFAPADVAVGVLGETYAAQQGTGVKGLASSGDAKGVWGIVQGSSSNALGWGVYGSTDSVSGSGVFGSVVHQLFGSNPAPGVEGYNSQYPGIGLGGRFEGGLIGVEGVSDAVGVGTRTGVRAYAAGATGFSYGLHATADDPSDIGNASAVLGYTPTTADGWAGNFLGNVNITGTLMLGGVKAFRIDHPLDPLNKFLQHSCIESPDMKNLYDGTVVLGPDGTAWVELPEWFEALNRDFRYQLTCLGSWAPVCVAREIEDNRFQIAGQPGMKISWQVTGTRQDPAAELHRLQVEVDKRPEELGLYQDAEAYGLPPEASLGHKLHVAPFEAHDRARRASSAATRARLLAESQQRAEAAKDNH